MAAAQWVSALAWLALAVALLAGFLATWAALVEFREWREGAHKAAVQAGADERERTQELHATQRRVLGAVHARVTTLNGELDDTKKSLDGTKKSLAEVTVKYGEASLQVSRLRGDNEALRIENDGLRTVGHELWVENRELRDRSDAAGAEAAAAVAGAEADEDADVLALPRRRIVVNAEWETGQAPTVVDLDLQRLSAPFVSELRERQAN